VELVERFVSLGLALLDVLGDGAHAEKHHRDLRGVVQIAQAVQRLILLPAFQFVDFIDDEGTPRPGERRDELLKELVGGGFEKGYAHGLRDEKHDGGLADAGCGHRYENAAGGLGPDRLGGDRLPDAGGAVHEDDGIGFDRPTEGGVNLPADFERFDKADRARRILLHDLRLDPLVDRSIMLFRVGGVAAVHEFAERRGRKAQRSRRGGRAFVRALQQALEALDHLLGNFGGDFLFIAQHPCFS